jgi:hypothetical protein
MERYPCCTNKNALLPAFCGGMHADVTNQWIIGTCTSGLTCILHDSRNVASAPVPADMRLASPSDAVSPPLQR